MTANRDELLRLVENMPNDQVAALLDAVLDPDESEVDTIVEEFDRLRHEANRSA